MDGVGNKTSVVEDGKVTTYATNSVNEYVYVDNQRLMYDRNGNMTSDGNLQMFYDHNNMLVEIRTSEYVFRQRFDAIGRRLMVQFSDGLTETRYFWYDGQQVIYEEVSGLTEPYKYVWGNGIDEALLRFGNGDIWYLDNQLGSVMALSDSSGQVIESYSYDVYGAVTAYDSSGQQIPVTNYDNRYLFTGREYNWQTKLYHYRARTYHPVLGRFLQRDLLRAETDYNYANNDPVLFVDPKGLLLCVRSEKSKGKGWKVASTDILVKWFVNLLRECGADVGLGYVYLIPWEATCCPGNPDYVMVLAYPTGEGYFHKRIKEIAASKKEICYEIRSRHPGGKMVSRFGQWQARQQLVFRSDFEAVRSALNRVKPNPALHGGFSVCELLLHEIVEQYLSAARYHAYGPSHKEALEVQSEYRRREGLKYWRTESPVRGLSIWRRIVPRQFHAGANLFSYTGESGRLIVVVSFRDSAAAVWSTELRNQR